MLRVSFLVCMTAGVVLAAPRTPQLRSTASLLRLTRQPEVDVPGQDSANDAVQNSKAGKVAGDLKGLERPESAEEAVDASADLAGLPRDVDTEDPKAVAEAHAYNYWHATTHNILEAVVSVISAILFTALFACCYKSYKEDPPALLPRTAEHNPELLDNREWRYGLCDCFSGDKVLCLLACCCPALRWADTMRMAGIYGFWTAVFLFACLSSLTHVTAGFAGLVLICVATMKRQAIKGLFQIENGTFFSYFKDCCIWCWCPCCAIIQEARQVEEAYAVQHRVVQQIPHIALRAK